ncbi:MULTISPECIES: LruC domain-containing protein [unclassified Shewanella]|uniref:LruC domain-containing protein n=1 Tax=unclassified Shewanella TaxID=196818 RepID=UPI00355005D8
MKIPTQQTVNANALNAKMIKILSFSSIAIGTSMALFSANTYAAEAFEACPTEAFIVQTPSGVPKTFGVELGTGSYTVLSPDMGLTKSLNGVGFSYLDNYLYGWDYEHGTVGKVGEDYQVEPLTIVKDSSAAAAGNFYVGDVAINENVWYGYRKNKGLFTVPLDGNDHPMNIVPGSKANATYNVTDFAFHPSNGFLYAVTNGSTGKLIKIDPSTGAAETIATVITKSSGSFTFGAQFFDPDGNLYLSNNGDGNVYKVNVDSDNPAAELFSYGPSSTSNDGARCALAEVPVGDSVDFGDAPDSYGTLIDSNGARHGIVAGMSLGSLVDNESDGYPAPLSDDESDGIDDDDGISMPTGFEIGESAMLIVTTQGDAAFLNGWIDWNQNGEFDTDEKVIAARSVNAGTTTLSIDVPNWATTGDTWARFRLSSVADILPTGGVSDGEVEDYPITVTETGITISYYPSSSEYTTLAYEDLYPYQGDFDMNDVVMQLRISQFSKNDMVRRVAFDAQLVAMGAAYHNGFAVQLPDIGRGNVQEFAIDWSMQGVKQTTSPLEAGQTNAVLLFSEDLWQHATPGNDCLYFRTEPGCGTQYRATWQMTVPFVDSVHVDDMPEFPYDPFIFATPGTDHSLAAKNITDGQNPGRKLEIHLKNKAPTDLFDTRFLGMHDDASAASQGHYFQDENGMSWAIEVPDTWQHPAENQRVDSAYIEFIEFAADESGETKPYWYLNATDSLIFKD